MIDSVLVRRAIDGDRSSIEEIARKAYPRVVAFCRSRVGQQADAEELAQETLLRAVKNLRSLKNHEQFGPWIRSIASNICNSWHRGRRATLELTDVAIVDRESPPLDTVAAGDEREMLLKRIRELPEDLQEVLHLFYYDEMTYDEMADWLNIARASVNERLAKARRLLRMRLNVTRSQNP